MNQTHNNSSRTFMERVKRSTTMASALLLLAGIARLGAATTGVEPLLVTGTLNPGACMTVTKTVHTPRIPPKPEIVFLVDTTASMGPSIASIQAGVQTTVNNVLGAQADAKFAVASYKDFTDGAAVYTLNLPLTGDPGAAAAVQVAVNALSAAGGFDIPEAGFNALTQVAGLPFAAGSSRVVVWIGDAPSHDPSGAATQASTIAALQAAGIRVIAVSVGPNIDGPGLDNLGQATAVATATGGSVLLGINPTQVSTAILAGIQAINVTVTADTSNCGVGVTVLPASVTVVSGQDAVFQETICLAGNATPCSKAECQVQWLLNGSAPKVAGGVPDPNFIQHISINVFCPPSGCNLYPIALNVNTVAGKLPGQTLGDIYNGSQSGNFGWLTWAGGPSEPTLTTSLTPPGNSSTYVNPNNAADHVVSVGDWVQGKPGVSNGKSVRDALDVLETIDIDVPIWDTAKGSGNNTLYHVVGFAKVRITDYRLPNQNRITAIYLGPGCVPR